ncbi:MAG: crossover junction endodeoxyribonuclease RuvC [Candidatus Gastranaerophilales bacterium]|nr:crossover junction endodeoxyribonuclease RuvC [Candidatus Gastranaerophilales bacterium]
MLILGIDPGIAITGYGLLSCENNNIKVLASGSIQTSKNKTTQERLAELFDDINIIIEKYQPDVASIEQLFYFKNLKTVIPVAQARGVIIMALAKHNIPLSEYTPLQVKQTITGFGRATKDEVKQMTALALNTNMPKLDDTVDAIAIALCHYRNNNI